MTLLHVRLLGIVDNTPILAHRCRQGASTPSPCQAALVVAPGQLRLGAPVLEPAMVSIGRETGAEVRIVEIGRHHLVQGRTVGLQPQQVVAAALADEALYRLGSEGRPLSPMALQIQAAQQRVGRHDLAIVLGRAEGSPADHRLARRGKGRDNRQGIALRGRVKGLAQGLAIEGDHALATDAQVLDEATETRRKGHRVQKPEQPRERIMARYPVGQAEKLTELSLQVVREIGKGRTRLRSTDRSC